MPDNSHRLQSKTGAAQLAGRRDGTASILDQRACATTHLQLKQKIDESPISAASRSINQRMTDEGMKVPDPARLKTGIENVSGAQALQRRGKRNSDGDSYRLGGPVWQLESDDEEDDNDGYRGYVPPQVAGADLTAARPQAEYRLAVGPGIGGGSAPAAPTVTERLQSASASASVSYSNAARAALDLEDRMVAAERNRFGVKLPRWWGTGEAGTRLLPDSEELIRYRLSLRQQQVVSSAASGLAGMAVPAIGGVLTAASTGLQSGQLDNEATGSGDPEVGDALRQVAEARRSVAVGGAVSSIGSAAVGAAVGQIAIPVPLVGAAIGAIGGAAVGGVIDRQIRTRMGPNADAMDDAVMTLWHAAGRNDPAALAGLGQLGISRSLAQSPDGWKAINEAIKKK